MKYRNLRIAWSEAPAFGQGLLWLIRTNSGSANAGSGSWLLAYSLARYWIGFASSDGARISNPHLALVPDYDPKSRIAWQSWQEDDASQNKAVNPSGYIVGDSTVKLLDRYSVIRRGSWWSAAGLPLTFGIQP